MVSGSGPVHDDSVLLGSVMSAVATWQVVGGLWENPFGNLWQMKHLAKLHVMFNQEFCGLDGNCESHEYF